MRAEEEARAAAYRARQIGIETARLARERAMAGDPAYLAQLREDTDPLLPNGGWDAPILVVEPDEDEYGTVVN